MLCPSVDGLHRLTIRLLAQFTSSKLLRKMATHKNRGEFRDIDKQ